MRADAKTETEVMSVLNKLAEAFRKKNLEDLMMLHVPDPDVVVIGSEAGEEHVGIKDVKAFFKRLFDNYEALSMEFSCNTISTAGTVAWAFANSKITLRSGDQEITEQGRITFVLEKRGDKWLMVQGHHSAP